MLGAMPNQQEDTEHSAVDWAKVGLLCEELFRRTPARDFRRRRFLTSVLPRIGSALKRAVAGRRVAALESELTDLIEKRREDEHRAIRTAIKNMLAVVYRATPSGTTVSPVGLKRDLRNTVRIVRRAD